MAHLRAALLALTILMCSSLRTRGLRRSSEHGEHVQSQDGSCVALKNRGSHSTVEVAVGTPPQKFDVVADTGSDQLIVKSCVCAELHQCGEDDRCFRGTNRSSTFQVHEQPTTVTISFGSGPVTTIVATDVVSVGGTNATMQESLLLMVEKDLKGLDIDGILGLGVHANAKAYGRVQDAELPSGQHSFTAPGFLEEAQIDRFSVCFNDDSDGVLRLGGQPPRGAKALGNVGQSHWGVGLMGISVGEQKAHGAGNATQFAVCDPATAKPGQKTPCAAIVDSGTTFITAPEEQLSQLYEHICEAWPSCKQSPKLRGAKNITEVLKYEVAKCDSESMPTLHFHVAGANGEAQILQLEWYDYVVQTQVEVEGKKMTMCMLAFGPMSWETDGNGPVWIFGTPFYYKYTVGYDLSTTPPQVSFGKHECTQCDALPKAESLLSRRNRRHRTLTAAPRYPRIDTSRPL